MVRITKIPWIYSYGDEWIHPPRILGLFVRTVRISVYTFKFSLSFFYGSVSITCLGRCSLTEVICLKDMSLKLPTTIKTNYNYVMAWWNFHVL